MAKPASHLILDTRLGSFARRHDSCTRLARCEDAWIVGHGGVNQAMCVTKCPWFTEVEAVPRTKRGAI